MPGKVHISAATYGYVTNKSRFVIEDRGLIDIKGKGNMQTYIVVAAHDDKPPEYSI